MMATADRSRRLGAKLVAARGVVWAERATVGLWPVAALLAAFAGLALMGLVSALPLPLHLALLSGLLAALAVLMVRRRALLPPPGWPAAERRLERDSGLRHRPFETLRDSATSTGGGHALWQLHQARAHASLAHLRLARPHAELSRHDPYALRAASLLLLLAGFAVAGDRPGARLRDAILPGLPGIGSGPPPVIQAWIQPPSYTGLPPVFLPAGGSPPDAPITVPTGSQLTVSITGLSAAPSLSLAGRALAARSLGSDSYQSEALLTAPGRLSIGAGFYHLDGWTLALLANEPPAVAWPTPPGRAGTALSTRLPWHVQQRWGVARLEAELRPANRPDLPARHIPLPLPGLPRDASGSAAPDLSADPYAGLTLTATLDAQDVSGQHGRSAAAELVLPARDFHHPLARAIADLRRRLALHPDRHAALSDELAALAEAPLARPVAGLPASGVMLNLAAGAALLGSRAALDPAVVAELQSRLWSLALALDGALPDAAMRALAQARDDLRRGLDEHQRGKLSDTALGQRLDALRRALDRRLAELAQKAQQQGALQKFDPHTQHLSAPGIDKLVRRLERDMREGRMDEAKQDMAALERLTEQLKDAHIMSPEEARAQQEANKQARGRQSAVQDMVQREATLLDHAQSRTPIAPPVAPRGFGLPPGFPPALAEQFEQLGQAPPAASPGAPEDRGTEDPTQEPQPFGPQSPASPDQGNPPREAAPSPKEMKPSHEDARTQRALHRALDALKNGLARAGRPTPQRLDDAGAAMADAATALADGHDPQARDAIARAIAALQQGGRDMSRQSGKGGSAGMQLSLQPGGDQGRNGQAGAGEDGQGEEGQGEEGGGEEGRGDNGKGESRGGRHTDPFGRPVDGSGTTADDPSLRVPSEMEAARSRAIQEELRRRGADRGRSKGELDYIDRLLKPF